MTTDAPGVTAGDVAAWLTVVEPESGRRYRRPPPPAGTVEWLIADGHGHWFVRWPTGQLRWHSEDWFHMRGITPPAAPLLGYGGHALDGEAL